MKYMIIQPMNGIPEEKIWEQREEIRKCVEYWGNEIVDTFFMEEAPENVKTPGIYYLGRAFMRGLCYADAVILAPGWDNARGCKIEREAARRYGIEAYEYIREKIEYKGNSDLMKEKYENAPIGVLKVIIDGIVED